MSITADRYWEIADQLVKTSSASERLQIMESFIAKDTGNVVLLTSFTRAIQQNGSRQGCPSWVVQFLEGQV